MEFKNISLNIYNKHHYIMNENFLNEFLPLLLGENKSIAFYLAAFIWSFIGICISLYHDSTNRNPESENTPQKFSWGFLLWDNLKRIGIGLMAMLAFFRFVPIESMEIAFGIGMFFAVGLDKAIQYLKNKYDFLKMDRNQFKSSE